jgi:formylglycine-generating enzyme required for sulfatase activity
LLLIAATAAGLALRAQGIEQAHADHAADLVGQVLDAEIAQVPEAIKKMDGYRRWADPLLRKANAEAGNGSRQKLNTSLALLPVDDSQVEYLYQRLLTAGPVELPVIRDALFSHWDSLTRRLWGVLQDDAVDPDERVRAACALATYDPAEDGASRQRWQGVSAFVANRLLTTLQRNPSHYDPLLKTLAPARDRLVGPLSEVFHDDTRPDGDRSLAASVLAEYLAERPDKLAELVLDADERQFEVLRPKMEALWPLMVPLCEDTLDEKLDTLKTEKDKERLAKRQANAAVVLFRLGGRSGKVWPLLRRDPPPDDPRVRSYVVHRLGPLGAGPKALVERLKEEKDVCVRRALLLALGELTTDQFPPVEREPLIPVILGLYREELDAGLHAAAEWLLRKWGQDPVLREAEQGWARDRPGTREREEQIRQELGKQKGGGVGHWYVNGKGQTMVVIPGPVEFLMGSPPTEVGREGGPEGKLEQLHNEPIGYSFTIAAKEVTVGQFTEPGFKEFYKEKFGKEYAPIPKNAPPDLPVNGVTWYEAVAYCYWLSKEEGLPEDQLCYEPNEKGEFAEGMRVKPGYLGLSGYRLPTEAEWEYACRAGAKTARYYGETDDLLDKYAWHLKNTRNPRMVPGGTLKPNDFGLFDTLGNALEWCHDHVSDYTPRPGAGAGKDNLLIKDDVNRVSRGGSFAYNPLFVRSAGRDYSRPSEGTYYLGFRLARTFR